MRNPAKRSKYFSNVGLCRRMASLASPTANILVNATVTGWAVTPLTYSGTTKKPNKTVTKYQRKDRELEVHRPIEECKTFLGISQSIFLTCVERDRLSSSGSSRTASLTNDNCSEASLVMSSPISCKINGELGDPCDRRRA